MKFETPKMNISMFEANDVVTTSGTEATTEQKVTAVKDSVSTALGNRQTAANTLEFTY